MRSAQKKTPASEKKNGKEQTSGKKLVQARLPFKIVAGTSSALDGGGVTPSETETLPKKRKLSYGDRSDSPNKKVGKSVSKENSSKSVKDDEPEDVIVLDDEEPETDTEPRTPVSVKITKRMKRNTPNSANKSNTPKVQIKLPLSGKKKRKKVDLTPNAKREVNDSSDVEIIDENNSNKKIKLSEDLVPEETISNDPKKIVEDPRKETLAKAPTETLEPEISSKTTSPTTKNSNNTEKDTSVAESRLRNKDGNSHKSPKKKDLETQSVGKECPAHQKNVKVSVKRLKTPKKGDSIKDIAETSKATGEEKSFSQNLENGENLNCEDISMSDTDGELDKSTVANTSTSSIGKKVLTPKQLKLIEHRKKAREEKERKLAELKEEKNRKLQEQREERERKLQEEKLQKQKEREERELQRKKEREEKDEQKKKEKEEKEEQRRKEKEDKERKRLAEVEAKNEEKRKRDEAKEEERRKKDEERRRKELEKEEEENKKKKAAQAFTKFFVPKTAKPCFEEDQESKDDMDIADTLAFQPFQVKGDMKLAPLVRREFNKSSREKLDFCLNHAPSKDNDLYLAELKSAKHIPLKGTKTVLKDCDEDVLIIEDELETAAEAISEARPKPFEKCRAKFLSFRENRRPPYYGTWRKRSYFVTARRPFATDKVWFDYEVDSDEEWEEEEPGESLNGSEDEKEESEDDDYEVDNEWFVPHGHLSDEELQNEDELGADTSREAQKAKLKVLQQEFAQEMKKKTEKIKPRLFGAIWEDENGNKPKLCPDIIWETLCARAMIVCEMPVVEEPAVPEREPSTPPPEKQKRLEINDELMIDLIRLVHGNRHSRVFLIKEFIEHVRKTCERIKSGECTAPTKTLIKEKIDEISEWSVVDDANSKKKRKKLCWVVSADILKKHSLEKLGLRNEWSYTLPPKFDSANETITAVENGDESLVEEKLDESKSDGDGKKKSSKSSITKFAKVLTSEEKKKILSKPSTDVPKTAKNDPSKSAQKSLPEASNAKTASSTTPVVKKRVALLMSVPPGQDFPTKSKNSLISKFLETNKSKTSSAKPDANVNSYLQSDKDDVVIIE